MAKKRDTDFFPALLFLLIPLVLFFIIVYYPQLLNLFYSFTNFDGNPLHSFRFVSLDNYRKFLSDKLMATAFANTFLFSICVTVLGTCTQLGMALVLYKGLKGAKVLRIIYYLPLLFSLVMLSVIWNTIFRFNGLLNIGLHGAGLDGLIRDWLVTRGTAMASIIFVNTWMGFGYGLIIFIAGLNSIPTELLEAATLDGAAGLMKFRHVTLPLIMYSITISLFLGIGTLNVFELPFIMTNGGPLDSTTTIAFVIYKNAFAYERFGYAAASAVLFTVVVGVLSFVQVRTTRRMEVEY
jgi:raffinose/stachyose/melibiose transport system permease protein